MMVVQRFKDILAEAQFADILRAEKQAMAIASQTGLKSFSN
jgi:hypothetical protein